MKPLTAGSAICSSSFQTDLVNHHNEVPVSRAVLLPRIGMMHPAATQEISAHCSFLPCWAEFTLLSFLFFIILFFTVFLSSCSPVWFSMDLNHNLLHCHPLHILPGAEFSCLEGVEIALSVAKEGDALWCHLRGNLTSSCPSHASWAFPLARVRPKAKKRKGKKRKGYSGVKWGNKEKRRDEPYSHYLQLLLLIASW